MAITDKLTRLAQTKAEIKEALIAKGADPANAPFKDYPVAIEAIPAGGEPVELTYASNYVQSALTDEAIANWELDTSSATNFLNMFHNCSSLTTVPQMDTSNGTSFNGIFNTCSSLESIPQLDTSKGKNFYNMFVRCYSLTTIPVLDTSAGTNFSDMFYQCRELTSIPQLDVSSGTNFSGMFYQCTKLASVPQMDVSQGTDFKNMFNSCSSLTQIGIYGFTRSIDISGCKLDADALNAFFTQAGEAHDETQTINITGNPGAADCDKTIATNKGWQVVG